MSTTIIKERLGFAGARRTSGGLGGPSRPPMQSIASGGVGGPVGAPHVIN